MPERGDTQLLEVFIAQEHERFGIDRVFGKGLGVGFKPQPAKPFGHVH